MLLSFARSLGIPHGINPARESAVERIREITGGRMAEAVIEASGSDAAIRSSVDYAAYSGTIALVGYPKGDVSLTTTLFTKKELDVMGSRTSLCDFPENIGLIAGGRIDVASLVTRTVSFEEVPAAVRAIAASPEKFMKGRGLGIVTVRPISTTCKCSPGSFPVSPKVINCGQLLRLMRLYSNFHL
jgi:threonine dehydrogenase-like Zn-dependent dehydrogenase